MSVKASDTTCCATTDIRAVLDNLIGTGDVKGIDTLKYRFLGYKPNTQIPSSSSSNRMSAGNSYPTYQNDHRYNLGTQMLPPNGRCKSAILIHGCDSRKLI